MRRLHTLQIRLRLQPTRLPPDINDKLISNIQQAVSVNHTINSHHLTDPFLQCPLQRQHPPNPQD